MARAAPSNFRHCDVARAIRAARTAFRFVAGWVHGGRPVSTAPVMRTMDDAAAALSISRRRLVQWLAQHPTDEVGVPFYVPNGNRKLFSDTDITRIIAFRRELEARRLMGGRKTMPRPSGWKLELPESKTTMVGPRDLPRDQARKQEHWNSRRADGEAHSRHVEATGGTW